jgi:hypothetical protein
MGVCNLKAKYLYKIIIFLNKTIPEHSFFIIKAQIFHPNSYITNLTPSFFNPNLLIVLPLSSVFFSKLNL